MALETGSKQPLDRGTARLHASRMRPPTAILAALLATPAVSVAQAPPWADLWRVADGTLAQPAAVATSPTGAFWNPTAVTRRKGPRFAIDAFNTPEVVNVSGLLVGATYGLGNHVGLGVLAGRMSVGDLIRTSSSPVRDEGSIPVYSQFLGAAVGGRLGPLHAGMNLLFHNARLDGRDEGGPTLDLGVRVAPTRGLLVGAASHLSNGIVSGGPATEYLVGAAYAFPIPPVLGLAAALHARYGLTVRTVGRSEHLGTLGLVLAERLMIDAGAVWAGGYGSGAWQPVLGLAFQAGPYRVGIARGSGASGIGGSYRLTLGIGDAL